MALILRQPRAATIKAVTDGTLWELDKSDFDKMVGSNEGETDNSQGFAGK